GLRELVDVPAQLVRWYALEQTEDAERVVPSRDDCLGPFSTQDRGDMTGAPALAGPRDGRQDLPRHGDRVLHALELAETPVARAARSRRQLLAEVLDDRAVAAAGRGGIPLHVAQQRAGALRPVPRALEQAAP